MEWRLAGSSSAAHTALASRPLLTSEIGMHKGRGNWRDRQTLRQTGRPGGCRFDCFENRNHHGRVHASLSTTVTNYLWKLWEKRAMIRFLWFFLLISPAAAQSVSRQSSVVDLPRPT